VDFKNTVIIMTSNIGARLIRGQGKMGFQKTDSEVTYQQMRSTVMEEVKKVFNPEFTNRLDEIIVFRALERSHMERIVDILLDQVRVRLRDHNMTLTITPGALALLMDKGFDPALGARPLRRAIQRLVEDPLADHLLRGKLRPGCEVRITKRGEELFFEERGAESAAKD
jgi:ATP-dependent Clp protease ATP-binding subunit ClpC